MTKQIPGVPETITRAQYLETIKALGIDPNRLTYLTFCPDCILATVRADNAEGKPYLDDGAIATHDIRIPVME